jgi:hypothetical protein
MSAFVPLVFMVIVFKITFETRTQHIDREFGNQLKNKELLKKLLIAQIATVWALYIMAMRTSPCFLYQLLFPVSPAPRVRVRRFYRVQRNIHIVIVGGSGVWRIQHVVGVFYC